MSKHDHDFDLPRATEAGRGTRSERDVPPVRSEPPSSKAFGKAHDVGEDVDDHTTKPAAKKKAPAKVAGAPQIPNVAEELRPLFAIQTANARAQKLRRLARQDPAVRELLEENARLRGIIDASP